MATVRKRRWTNVSGTHEAWVLAFTDTAGKRHKEQFSTKRAADTRRVEVEGQVAKGAYRERAVKHTVAYACDRYIGYLETRHERGEKVTGTYLATTRGELENYVTCKPRSESETKNRNRVVTFNEGIGTKKLAHLTPGDVSDLVDRLRAAGVTVSNTRRVVASLSRALAYAMSKNLVGNNAAKGIRVVGTRKDGPKKVTPPTKAQIRAMFEAADPDFRMRLQFAALSGLRASEQWALRWRHIDLNSGEVHVETRLDRYGVEDTTKSEAGTRTVPIGQSLVKALKTYRPISASPDNLVFPVKLRTKKGEPPRYGFTNHGNMLKRQFKPLAEQVGARSSLGWHALRHFAVSLWIEDGRPPKTVQVWAGHATLAITMSTYGHLFPSDDHKAAMDRIADTILA